jgi:hypothetical protein
MPGGSGTDGTVSNWNARFAVGRSGLTDFLWVGRRFLIFRSAAAFFDPGFTFLTDFFLDLEDRELLPKVRFRDFTLDFDFAMTCPS